MIYFVVQSGRWIYKNLDRGKKAFHGKGKLYSSWLDQKVERMLKKAKNSSKRQKTLERELEWVTFRSEKAANPSKKHV